MKMNVHKAKQKTNRKVSLIFFILRCAQKAHPVGILNE